MSICQLGPILTPTFNQVFQTVSFPFSTPITISSNTPINQFVIQISTCPLFSTINGIFTVSNNGTGYINVNTPGTYYIRASCNGTTWGPYVVITIEQVAPTALSSIFGMTLTLSTTNNDQFIITIPQLLYGPPLTGNIVYDFMYYSNTLEVEISTDPTFTNNVYRFFYYAKFYGQLATNVATIPNLSLTSTYYARARLLLNNDQWEPYTTISVSWSNS